jgi:ABC-type multidrug transport system ATPase subunit
MDRPYAQDIFVDTRAYHMILSLAFQDNALTPVFAAREHLELCARLQGKTADAQMIRIDMFNSMLSTRDFIQNASENLRGGSKRKLCLAMTRSKNSEVLVCDEPCAGIDIEARQILGRTISAYP